MTLGCGALSIVSRVGGIDFEIIRLRSGDAILMNVTSMFAWHAVPQILPSTCPSWLADWPSLSDIPSGTASSPYSM